MGLLPIFKGKIRKRVVRYGSSPRRAAGKLANPLGLVGGVAGRWASMSFFGATRRIRKRLGAVPRKIDRSCHATRLVDRVESPGAATARMSVFALPRQPAAQGAGALLCPA